MLWALWLVIYGFHQLTVQSIGCGMNSSCIFQEANALLQLSFILLITWFSFKKHYAHISFLPLPVSPWLHATLSAYKWYFLMHPDLKLVLWLLNPDWQGNLLPLSYFTSCLKLFLETNAFLAPCGKFPQHTIRTELIPHFNMLLSGRRRWCF